MHAKQVMTPNVTVVSPATAISEIARKMREEEIGVALVVDKSRLIGVITGRESMSSRLLYRSLNDVQASWADNRARRLPS